MGGSINRYYRYPHLELSLFLKISGPVGDAMHIYFSSLKQEAISATPVDPRVTLLHR